MGHKGSQKFSGARGLETLDLGAAIAKASDAEIQGELEDAQVSAAKEHARQQAPRMMEVLVDVAEDRDSTPAARVSAAKEVLHHAEGKPSTQKPEERDLGQGLTIMLVNYEVKGQERHEEIDVSPVFGEPVSAETGVHVEVEVDPLAEEF